jgi:hypothetical protein
MWQQFPLPKLLPVGRVPLLGRETGSHQLKRSAQEPETAADHDIRQFFGKQPQPPQLRPRLLLK